MMQRLSLLLCLLLTSTGALAVSPDTLRFATNTDTSLVLIPGTVNGKEFLFLLDCGAPTCIFPKVADAVKPPKRKKGRVLIDARGNRTEQTTYTLEQLKVGSIEKKDLSAALLDAPPGYLTNLGVGGIIGYDFMNQADWLIDYPSTRVIVALPGVLSGQSFSCYFSFRDEERTGPVTQVALPGQKPMSFTIDFGYNGFISMPQSLFRSQAPLRRKAGFVETALGLRVDTINIYHTDTLTLGDHLSLLNLPVFTDPGNTGNYLIGQSFLKMFGSILLSYKDQRLYTGRLTSGNIYQKSVRTVPGNNNSAKVVSMWLDAGTAAYQVGDTTASITGPVPAVLLNKEPVQVICH